MTVRSPRPSTNGPARQPAVLVVFATDTVALTRLAADLAALLGIDAGGITLAVAAPVRQPAAAGRILSEQLADRTAVDRALGVLLDQGWGSRPKAAVTYSEGGRCWRLTRPSPQQSSRPLPGAPAWTRCGGWLRGRGDSHLRR